jgi:ATP-dependent DNA helicase DinG
MRNKSKKYIVCDTETGGLNPFNNALISVAVIGLDENLEKIGEYYAVIKDDPNKTIEPKALEVNGFTLEQIKEEGQDLSRVMRIVTELFKNAIPVFHNGAFDAGFLNARGMNITTCIDTLEISRYKFYGKSARLGDVIQYFGFSIENAHHSLGDAIMTTKILKEFARSDPSILIPRDIKFKRY